jgi:hypothetical protein
MGSRYPNNYDSYARQCQQMADKTRNASEKGHWETLARHWNRLAEINDQDDGVANAAR